MLHALNFDLPIELEAGEPPVARGLTGDKVLLMVSYYSSNRVVHTQFRNLKGFLEAGDLLVINTSGTMNAALTFPALWHKSPPSFIRNLSNSIFQQAITVYNTT